MGDTQPKPKQVLVPTERELLLRRLVMTMVLGPRPLSERAKREPSLLDPRWRR